MDQVPNNDEIKDEQLTNIQIDVTIHDKKTTIVEEITKEEITKEEITKEEITKEEIKVVIQPLISDMLKEVISNNEKLKELSLDIDNQTRDTLVYLLDKYPEYFSNFKTLVELIIEDGKININDITNIIKLLTKLYELIKNIKLDYETSLKVSGDILKFVIHYLIKERKIVLMKMEEAVVLSSIDMLIDTCLELMRQNKQIEKGCSSFLKKLMCKK
jgi:hypothetical protein